MTSTTKFHAWDINNLLALAYLHPDPLIQELLHRFVNLPKYKEQIELKCLECQKKHDIYLDQFLK